MFGCIVAGMVLDVARHPEKRGAASWSLVGVMAIVLIVLLSR
jgi:hypothetical protein